MRKLLHILSALLIAVTAQAFAAARTADAPAGQMVLCVGKTVLVVMTDADGNPVEVPHICPEATLLAASAPAQALPQQPRTLSLLNPPALHIAASPAPAIHAAARAPPVLV